MRITGISGLHAVQSPTEENSKRVVGGASRLVLKERARVGAYPDDPGGRTHTRTFGKAEGATPFCGWA